MKFFSLVLLTVFLLIGCGEGSRDAHSQNLAFTKQTKSAAKLGLKNDPDIPLGIDNDKNGVWDDTDQYISSRFKDPEKAKAMRQVAIAIQNALINNDPKKKGKNQPDYGSGLSIALIRNWVRPGITNPKNSLLKC